MRSLSTIVITILVAACSHSTPQRDPAEPTSNTSTVTESSAAFSHKGPVNCEACKGETELQLFTHSNTYKLQSGTHVLTGSYNTERGFETDENATLYILNDEMPARQQLCFVRETSNDSGLVQLDGRRHRLNHFLKRTK